jgi:hypothetical protein
MKKIKVDPMVAVGQTEARLLEASVVPAHELMESTGGMRILLIFKGNRHIPFVKALPLRGGKYDYYRESVGELFRVDASPKETIVEQLERLHKNVEAQMDDVEKQLDEEDAPDHGPLPIVCEEDTIPGVENV